MYNYYNQIEIEKYNYRKQLNKDMYKAGGFLLVLFGAMFFSTFVIMMLITMTTITNSNLNTDMITNDTFLMLINGLISIISFFGVGYLYCKITNIKFVEILPFEKIKASILIPLCLMGLSFAMVSNYASDAILELFDFFGADAYVNIDFKTFSFTDVITYYVSIAVVPAFVEEFAFRGIVLGCLRKYSDTLAIIVSSVMFSLMHGNFTQIPFAFAVGLILGFIVIKTNSLLPAVVVHFLNNAVSVTLSILVSSQNLSAPIIDLIYIGILISICVLGIISVSYLIKKHDGFFKLSDSNKVIPFKEKIAIFCQNATMIIFTVLMLLEAVFSLNIGV